MIADRSRISEKWRSGFGLIEIAVTAVLIVVAMTVTVQVVGWMALERKAVGRRERAVQEAENLLERAVALPWRDLTAESAGKLRISPKTAEFLGKPTLKVDVSTIDDAPARKKVVVEIRWPDRSGQPEAPVRLVAWVHRKGEDAR